MTTVFTTPNIEHVTADIKDYLPPLANYMAAFAFPPCTHTAVSGARYFQSKGPERAAEAFAVIARCDRLIRWTGAPGFFEQPVSTASTYCGKPDVTFNPCDFAGHLYDPSFDAYNKKTCLWTYGGFKLPSVRPVEPVSVCKQGSWVQKLGGKSEKTKRLRSATPQGAR